MYDRPSVHLYSCMHATVSVYVCQMYVCDVVYLCLCMCMCLLVFLLPVCMLVSVSITIHVAPAHVCVVFSMSECM
jgi:hypothetical protein